MTSAYRVLVVYQHLPHYRSGVFAELQESSSFEYEFAADTKSRDGSIPTIPPTSLRRFHRLTNRWFGRFLWQQGLLTLMRRERYQAVVFLGDVAYLSTWVGAALCRAFGTQALFWTIGWHRPERGLRKHVRMAFYRIPRGLMLYGHTGLKIGQGLGYPPERMTVIGNSHSAHLNNVQASTKSEMDELQRHLPQPGTDVVTAVIRLNSAKRLDLLVLAAAHLKAHGRTVTVLLAGAGPESERLRKLAVNLDVDLRMLGPVYADDQLKLIYETTTVTVVPMYAGLTAIQSLLYGRPVITSDNEYHQMPESECIRPGQTGDFYTDGSIEHLAASIEEWLDRMRTDAREVGDACREEVRTRWSPQNHSAAICAAVARGLNTGSESR